MIGGFHLRPVRPAAIDVQGQSGDHLRQDPHAGVHRGHLHGGALIDRSPRRCRAEQERVARRELRVGGTAPKPISYGQGASFANVW